MPFRYGIEILQSVLMHTTEKSWYGGNVLSINIEKGKKTLMSTNLVFCDPPDDIIMFQHSSQSQSNFPVQGAIGIRGHQALL